MTATPSARGWRNRLLRPSFRPGAAPVPPERYPTGKAVERGIGWLKHGRRVATRYDQYAHRCLRFLDLDEVKAPQNLKPKIYPCAVHTCMAPGSRLAQA